MSEAATAVSKNPGWPSLAACFNWLKAAAGIVPATMAGTAIGPVIFGIASVYAAYRIAGKVGGASA